MQHEAVNCRIWGSRESNAQRIDEDASRGRTGSDRLPVGLLPTFRPSGSKRDVLREDRERAADATAISPLVMGSPRPGRIGAGPAVPGLLTKDQHEPRLLQTVGRLSLSCSLRYSSLRKCGKRRRFRRFPRGFQVRRGRDPTLSKTGAVHDISGARGHAHVTRIAHCWSGRSGPWRSKVMSGLGVISP
jgi:hypothetical protein